MRPLAGGIADDLGGVAGLGCGDSHGGHGQSRTTMSPVPDGTVAVVLNATVTGTQGTGYLSVTPPGSDPPTTSTVNWFSSPTTRANGSIIPTEDGANRSYVGGNFSTHYLFDLAGYFR